MAFADNLRDIDGNTELISTIESGLRTFKDACVRNAKQGVKHATYDYCWSDYYNDCPFSQQEAIFCRTYVLEKIQEMDFSGYNVKIEEEKRPFLLFFKEGTGRYTVIIEVSWK